MLGRFSGNLVEGSPVVVDPLLSLTAPSSFGLSSQTANTNTLAPGVYNDVVAFTGGQKVTMTGGTYIFKNGLTLDGGSSITSSSGVLLYFQNGGITLTGSSSLNITALNDGSPYGSVAIYMDRANHSNISMTNSSSLVTNGTIYAPSNQLNLSDSASISSTGNLIGAAATLNGSPSITIDSNAGSPANNSVTLVQ